MRLLVGLEDGAYGRQLAWALDYPGCFAYGVDGTEAIIAMAPAFIAYKSWVARHTPESWLSEIDAVDVSLNEVFHVYYIDEDYNTVPNSDYEVNAWFRHDWKPLTRLDVRRGLQLLSYSRADLLETIKGLSDAVLDRTYPEEIWSIRGVLRHVANAESFYLAQLERASGPESSLPEDVLERLEVVRRQLNTVLPELEGVDLVRGSGGELWSPRKLLRRSVWHELDHIEHIQKLIAKE